MPTSFHLWLSEWLKAHRKRTSRRRRWATETLVPTLRVVRLEERRVLNADGAPIQQLIIDATTGANDGHPDTFHVEQIDKQISFSVNGKEIGRTQIGATEAITIHGTADDDTFVFDLQDVTQLGELKFNIDGGGGHDVLRLSSTQLADRVVYDVNRVGSANITVTSLDRDVTITSHGVDTIEDSVRVRDREFQIAGDQVSIIVDDAGANADDFSRLAARFTENTNTSQPLDISFRNSTDSLTFNSVSISDRGRNNIVVEGLDELYKGDLYVLGSHDDSVSMVGQLDTSGGKIDVSSGNIFIRGSIATHDASIKLRATDSIQLYSSTKIYDSLGDVVVAAPSIRLDGTIVNPGGDVSVDSGAAGRTYVGGIIDVSLRESRGIGGTVHVLGAAVALDGARISADGSTGGGAVLVGGDFQGKNSAIRNSIQTWVGVNTTISANAELTGTGGRIIVWANESNQFFGNVVARGGAASGDGGLVEVSSAGALSYLGQVDLSTSEGTSGTLFLDPATITINGGSPPSGGSNFAGDMNQVQGSVLFSDTLPLIIYESQIEAQSATANIVLEATQSIDTSGDFIDNAVTLAANRNLTLRTRNSAADGVGKIDLTSSLDGAGLLFQTAGSGTITIEGSTSGQAVGDVSISKLTSEAGTILISTRNGLVQSFGEIMSDSDVKIIVNGDVVVDSPVHARSFVIRAPGDFDGSGERDQADYSLWQSTFGSTTDFQADDNNDSSVDAADYLIWRTATGGPGTVTLRDDITTSGTFGVNISSSLIVLDGSTINAGGSGNVRLNGPTLLQGNATLRAVDGDITFTRTLDGAVAEAQTLTLADANGTISFEGVVGGAPGGSLGDVNITAKNVNVKAGLQARSFVVQAPGDYDGSGAANQADFNLWRSTFGSTTDLRADGNGDSKVDAADYLIWRAASGSSGNVTLNGNVITTAPIGVNISSNQIELDNSKIDAGSLGIVRLNAANGAREKSGSLIQAKELLLTGVGAFELLEANEVATLAASIQGPLSYRDANDLTVGTVMGTAGLKTRGSDVKLDVTGNLQLNEAIDLGSGDLQLVVTGRINDHASIDANDIVMTAPTIILDGPTIVATENTTTTDRGTVKFDGAVTLAASTMVTVVNTSNVTVEPEVITFTKQIDSVPQNVDLSLTAGDGNIVFQNYVGSAGKQLGQLVIANAHDVTAYSTIAAKSFVQITGTGTTTLKGDVTAENEIALTNDAFLVQNADTTKLLYLETTDSLPFTHKGGVTLNALNTSRNWTDSLKNVVIRTGGSMPKEGGSITDKILALQTEPTNVNYGAYTALEGSFWGPNTTPIIGREGKTSIEVVVADVNGIESGSNFTVTINWREGDLTVNPPPDNGYAWYDAPVLANIPAGEAGKYDHTFTRQPEGVNRGQSIPVYIAITQFANGTIKLETNGKDILAINSPSSVPAADMLHDGKPNGVRLINGSPNGIQFTIPIDVFINTGHPAVPVSVPRPKAPAPPVVVAAIERPTPPIIVAPNFAQAASSVTASEEDRIYQLRIVSVNESGREVEEEANFINLTQGDNNKNLTNSPKSIYPFNPGKLRELFRRLPDDHYRIYLIERGSERLILDFTIQQGRPVEIKDETELPAPVDSNQENLTPGTQKGESTAEPKATVSPATNALPNSQSPARQDQSGETVSGSFAERLGRAAMVAQGGLVLMTAGLSSLEKERLADDRIAQFGRRYRKLRRRKGSKSKSVSS